MLLVSKKGAAQRRHACANRRFALTEQSSLAHLQASLQMRLRSIITDGVRVVQKQKRDTREGYLSFAGGPSRTRTLDRPVMSR